jgi:hypothetical protein
MLVLSGICLSGQNAALSSAAAAAATVESPYVWLGFFQEHSRLLNDAGTKGKGNPDRLRRERDRAGYRFGLTSAANAKVIPLTGSWKQLYAVVAVEQRSNRQDIQQKKATGNRQQYLAFLARRDKIVLDAVNSLMRTLSPREFQLLKQRVYAEYGGK